MSHVINISAWQRLVRRVQVEQHVQVLRIDDGRDEPGAGAGPVHHLLLRQVPILRISWSAKKFPVIFRIMK
jgi:hypothetical protein